jgi:DNA repair exonuclease SbcCD ATPase subunit
VQPEAAPESGFTPALKAGVSGLKSAGAALAGRTGLLDEERAKQIMEEEAKYQQKTFKPTETWGEAPVTKGLELLGGSLPYMAAPLALGAAGAAAPIAGAGTAAAGLASLAQFTGTNLQRQMEEGKQLGETSLGGAAAAAVPQAALDMLSFKMMPGIRQIFAAAGKDVSEKAAVEIAKQGTKEILKDYGVGALRTAGVEGLTEAGQQFFERLQAGLSIGDEAARSEYFDNFIGGAVLGGTLAPAGRYVERGQTANVQAKARREEEKRKAEEAARLEEAEKARQEEFKKTPEYLDNIKQSYDELRGKLDALEAAAKIKPAKTDLAAQERVREARKALNDLKKDPATVELVAKYNEALPRLGERAKAEEEAKLREAATEEVFGEKAQAKQQETASDVAQAQNIFGQIQELDAQMKAATGLTPAERQPMMNRRNALEDALKPYVPSRDEYEATKQKLDGLITQAYTGLTTAKTTAELQRYDSEIERYKTAMGNLQKFEPMLEKVQPVTQAPSAESIRAKIQKEQSNGEGADIEKIRRLTRQLAEAEKQGELQFEGYAVESPLADEIAAGAKAARERRALVEKETEALTRIGNKELSPFELALKRERLQEARAMLRKSRGASKSEVSNLIRLNEQDWSRLKEDPENVMYGQDRDALAESLKAKIREVKKQLEEAGEAGPSLLSKEYEALTQSLAEVQRKIEMGRKVVEDRENRLKLTRLTGEDLQLAARGEKEKAAPDVDTALQRVSDERVADLIDRLLPLATAKEKGALAGEQASLFDVEAQKRQATKAFEAAPPAKEKAEPTRVQEFPIEQAQRLMEEARDARALIKDLNEKIQKAGRPTSPEKVQALEDLKAARDTAQNALLQAQRAYDRLTEISTPAYEAKAQEQGDLFGDLEEARGEANKVKADLDEAYARRAEVKAGLERRNQLGRTPELQALADKYSKETFTLKEADAEIEKLEREYERLTGKVSDRYGAFVEQREAARVAEGSSTLAEMKAQLADLKEKLPYFKKVGDERSIKAVEKAVTSLEYDIAETEEKGEKAVRSRTPTLPGFERRAGVRAPSEDALTKARTKMVNLQTLNEDLRIALADQGGDPTRYLREVAAKKLEELQIHKVQTDNTAGMDPETVKVLKSKYPGTKEETERDKAYYGDLEKQIKYLNNVMKGRNTKVLNAAIEKNLADIDKARAEVEKLESRKRAYEQQEAVRTGVVPGTAEAQRLIEGQGYRTVSGATRVAPKKLTSWGITELTKKDKVDTLKQSAVAVRSAAELQKVTAAVEGELEIKTQAKKDLEKTVATLSSEYNTLKDALDKVYSDKLAKETETEIAKLNEAMAKDFPDAKPEDVAAAYREVKKDRAVWQPQFAKLVGRLNKAAFEKAQELNFAEKEADSLLAAYDKAKAKYDKIYKSKMTPTTAAQLSNAEYAERVAHDAYTSHQANEVRPLQQAYMEARVAQLNLTRLYGEDLKQAVATSADNLAKLSPQFAKMAAEQNVMAKKVEQLATKAAQAKAAENIAKREATATLSEARKKELEEESKRKQRIAEGLGLPGTRFETDTTNKLATMARTNVRRLLALKQAELETVRAGGDQVEVDRVYAQIKELEKQLEQVQALGQRVVTPVGEGKEDREVEVVQPKPVEGERLAPRKEGPVARRGTMPPGQLLSGTPESRVPLGKKNTPVQTGAVRIRASDMDPEIANAISLATLKTQVDAATGERKTKLEAKYKAATEGMTKAQVSNMVSRGNEWLAEGGTLEVIAARQESRDALAALKAAEKDLREAQTPAAKEIARDSVEMANENFERAERKLANAQAMAELQPSTTGKKQANDALDAAIDQADNRQQTGSMKAVDDAYNDLMETSYKTGYRHRAELTTAEAIRDGRLLDALDYLSQVGHSPLIREQAEKLRPLVLRTKVKMNPDLVDKYGNAIPAAYDPATNTVFFRNEIAEEDIIHEVTHAATVRTMTMPEADLTPTQLAARREIVAMYKLAKADPKLNGPDGSKAYGVKNELEFVSEVQSNADFRAKLDKKPWIKRFWSAIMRLIGYSPKESVSEKASRLIETIYAPAKNYIMPDDVGVLPSIYRAAEKPKSAIVGYAPGKIETFRKNVFGIAGRVQYIDRLAAADAGIIAAEGEGKLTSMEAFNAQYFMRMGEQVTQAAGQFITDGPVRIVADKKAGGTEYRFESTSGPSLLNVSKGVEDMANIGDMSADEAERMLTSIIAGKRASALPNGWQRLNTSDPAAAKAEYEADVRRMNADPALKSTIDRTIEEYKKYNQGLLDFAAQCGYLSKDEVKRLASTPYVPFYRIENEVVQLYVAGEKPVTIGNIKDNPDLKQFLGDDKHIMPILTSAVQNTFMLTRAAMRNKATMETSNALYKAGFVSKMGKGAGFANKDTVHYKIEGEDHFAVIDSDTFGIPANLIVQGMEGIKTTIPDFVRMMGVPANWLRKFITRSPAYVIRQLLREPVNAAITGGVDGVPILNALKQMRDMRADRSPSENALMRGLIVSSNVYTGGEQDMQKFLNDVAAGRTTWDKWISKLDNMALQADTATRAVIYEDSLKKGFSEAQAQFRAFEAQNFSRRGLSPSMQMLSTMIPFFNAQIQGLDVLYRSLTGKMPFAQRLEIQRKIVARGSMLFAMSLAYAMMMQDDEGYKKARPEERYGNIFVPLPGTKDMLKIPVPFETGVLFMGLPQMLVDMAAGNTADKDAIKGMGKLLLQSAPGVIPTGPKPFLEAYYNQTGMGPVESEREKNIEAQNRFRSETTQVARMLGGITGHVGVSPIMLEHFVKGYTGNLGIALLSTLNPVLREFNPVKEGEQASTAMNKLPFVGGLFQPAEGRFLIDRAYDRMDEIVQAQQTYKDLVARGQRAEAATYAQKNAALIGAASEAGAFRQQMGEYFALERQIRANPNLSKEKKDQMLAALKKQENTYSEMLYKLSEKTKRQ